MKKQPTTAKPHDPILVVTFGIFNEKGNPVCGTFSTTLGTPNCRRFHKKTHARASNDANRA